MPSRLSSTLLACVLAASGAACAAEAPVHPDCTADRARLLALDQDRFDQDMAGGWRALAAKPGCEPAAADLLRDYRQAHPKEAGLLVWHEAQLRAFAGQSREAIALMEQAHKPPQADRAGWNPYVDATIAFLRHDRAALEQARVALAAVVPPAGKDMPPVVDGYMEAEFADGSKRRIRWPLNIDVVEGLQHCFDKSYGEAYAEACRVRTE